MGDLGTHICHHYFYNCTIVHSPYPYMLQIFRSDTKCVYRWLLERIIFIKWRVSRDELLYLTCSARSIKKDEEYLYKEKILKTFALAPNYIRIYWDTLYFLTRLYTIHLYYTQFMWIVNSSVNGYLYILPCFIYKFYSTCNLTFTYRSQQKSTFRKLSINSAASIDIYCLVTQKQLKMIDDWSHFVAIISSAGQQQAVVIIMY